MENIKLAALNENYQWSANYYSITSINWYFRGRTSQMLIMAQLERWYNFLTQSQNRIDKNQQILFHGKPAGDEKKITWPQLSSEKLSSLINCLK